MSNIPSYAGPVRSGRVPMASLREMWGGAWIFYGWQNTVVQSGKLIVDVDSWALNLHEDARQNGRWVFPFIEGSWCVPGRGATVVLPSVEKSMFPWVDPLVEMVERAAVWCSM